MSQDGAEPEDDLQAFMPTSFGKQSHESNVAIQLELARRKVDTRDNGVKQPEKIANNDGDEDDSDDEDDDSDDDDEFPTSHELIIKTHDKAVTSVTLDAAGTRLITGSNDCTFKLHDFASMTPTTVRAFRTIDPSAQKTSANVETHPINLTRFNPIAASLVLVVTAHPQPKIYDRDGELVCTFVKGDMYLRDMHNTKGHVSEVTGGDWHPTNRELCVTAGTDSTLRIWDINNPRQHRDVIVHKSRAAGSAGRTRMTSVRWMSPTHGGPSALVAAGFDGSLAMWSGDGPYSRPAGEIRDAHTPDTWTSGLDISPDGRTVVTRGGDDTIKLWDTRKFTKAVTVVSHPSTSSQFQSTNIRFSPSGANIITGSSTGDLHILNPATLKPELVTPITPGSPLIVVEWHPKLNQIITASANAETHVLFNPGLSHGGALTVMSKAPKRRHIDDDPNLTMDLSQGISGDSISAPGAGAPPRHPTIGLTASGKSRDPRRPHIPATTPFGKTQLDEKHLKEHIPLSSMRDEDPREALLKYAEKAEKDPMFTNAWKHTQPKTIYAELSDEDDEPDRKKSKR